MQCFWVIIWIYLNNKQLIFKLSEKQTTFNITKLLLKTKLDITMWIIFLIEIHKLWDFAQIKYLCIRKGKIHWGKKKLQKQQGTQRKQFDISKINKHSQCGFRAKIFLDGVLQLFPPTSIDLQMYLFTPTFCELQFNSQIQNSPTCPAGPCFPLLWQWKLNVS